MLKFGNLVISRVIKQSVRAGPGFAFLILPGLGQCGAGLGVSSTLVISGHYTPHWPTYSRHTGNVLMTIWHSLQTGNMLSTNQKNGNSNQVQVLTVHWNKQVLLNSSQAVKYKVAIKVNIKNPENFPDFQSMAAAVCVTMAELMN